VTRSIFRLLPPPGCPTGTVIAPGDMRGYRRAGESGLSNTQVFFVARLVVSCGQRMPRGWRLQPVRLTAVEPLQIPAIRSRNRQGFTRAGDACESVRVVVAQPAQLDSGGTTDRLRKRIWWPAVRSCGRPANRELRCDSGTAPPLYLGDSSPRGDRPADFRAIVGGKRSLSRPREGDSRSSPRVRRPTSIHEERVPAARAVVRARSACAGR